jgi:diacylglycerol kinase family enzyme
VLLKPPALLNLTITADGHLLSRRTPLLFAGTNAYQMETFAIPGTECVASRRLTLYVTKPMGPIALAGLAARALTRGLHGVAAFETLCASDILVSMRRHRVRVAMDGEVHVLDTPLRFAIRRDALRVVVPPVAPAG